MDKKPPQTAHIFHIQPELQGQPGTDSEFYQRTLKPFEDLQFFKERSIGKSRFLRINPSLEADIAQAMKTDSDDDISHALELINISREIDSPTNETPFNKLLAAMNLQREILQISQQTNGVEAETFGVITLVEKLYAQMADESASSELQDYLDSAYFIFNQTMALAEEQKTRMQTEETLTVYEYTARRLLIYIHATESRIDFNNYLAELGEKDTTEVSPEQVLRDDEEIAELFKSARQKQAYGVKLGYKAQESRSGSLVYLPPEKMLENFDNLYGRGIDAPDSYARHTSTMVKSSLATVVDTTKKSFHKGIVIKTAYNDTGRSEIVTNIKPRAGFEIFEDGSLKAGTTNRNTALDAAVQGHYQAFRALQAEMIANYIDLVSPLEVSKTAKTANSEPVSDTAPKESDEKDNDSAGMNIVRKLLIRRIKAIQELSSHATSNDSTREVRLHGVVWHIRQLPNGWHATPQAQELAREVGIVLAEGETFVKPHKRGSIRLGEVVSHELVRR